MQKLLILLPQLTRTRSGTNIINSMIHIKKVLEHNDTCSGDKHVGYKITRVLNGILICLSLVPFTSGLSSSFSEHLARQIRGILVRPAWE